MKIKLILFSLVLFFSLSISKTLSSDFLVLSMYGKITKKGLNEKNWTAIKTGSDLKFSDEIKLPEKSYICLYHETGNSFEFKKPGIYKLNLLSDLLKKKGKPSLDIIGQYLFKQIFEADNNIFKDSKTGTMSISIGGVERRSNFFGSETNVTIDKSIIIKPPTHYFTIDDNIELSWYPINKNQNYTLLIVDSNNDTVLQQNTKDTSFKVDLSKLKLEKDVCYFWSVSSDVFKSDSYCLYLINDADKGKIIDEVKEIESQFEEQQSPIKDMALAMYYSSKKIDDRAIKHFENALKSAPDSFEYRKIFALYLAKSGFTDEATNVLNMKY